jgi:hypothetical protein
MKAKDVLKMIDAHEEAMSLIQKRRSGLDNMSVFRMGDPADLPNDNGIIHNVLMGWFVKNFNDLLPDEVIRVLAMSRSDQFMFKAMQYVLSELNQMSMEEVTSIYYAIFSKELHRRRMLEGHSTAASDT